jgi:streptogramin lyase
VAGDETFALINIGNGQVAFKLINPSAYVSARLDQPDPRTDNDGISVSVRSGFTLFSSSATSSGTYVTSVADWERFELVGADSATLSRIMTVAVTA